MRRLDDEEARTRERPPEGPTPAGARRYLEDLAALWRETDEEGRRAMAEVLFERVEVLGVEDALIQPTPTALAYGFAEAFAAGPVRCTTSRYGRGERS